MKAVITAFNEPTVELCKWSLERNGFEVILFQDDSSFWQKLSDIYNAVDEDFVRIDADVIVNRNLNPELINNLSQDNTVWWWQFTMFDWYKMDVAYGMSFIRQQALPVLRSNIGRFKDKSRPETEVSRIPELHNPRRFKTYDKQIVGLHGYGIKDIKPVIKLKANRGQSANYDFELTARMNQL